MKAKTCTSRRTPLRTIKVCGVFLFITGKHLVTVYERGREGGSKREAWWFRNGDGMGKEEGVQERGREAEGRKERGVSSLLVFNRWTDAVLCRPLSLSVQFVYLILSPLCVQFVQQVNLCHNHATRLQVPADSYGWGLFLAVFNPHLWVWQACPWDNWGIMGGQWSFLVNRRGTILFKTHLQQEMTAKCVCTFFFGSSCFPKAFRFGNKPNCTCML